MSDRELLEFAANAAGYVRLEYRDDVPYVSTSWSGDDFVAWNPLDHDGDALRLLAAIPSLWSLSYKFGPVFEVNVAWGMGRGIGVKLQVHENDKLAMLRRAIVSAAAEIGKAKASADPL